MLIGNGPSGTGMQETAQITTALRYLPWGKQVALVTDGRFSGILDRRVHRTRRTGSAGRRTDRARARRRSDRDRDRSAHARPASVNLVGTQGRPLVPPSARAAARAAAASGPRAAPDHCPDDTRLWAALQRASGGTWAGCVYDVDRIVAALDAAAAAKQEPETG